MLREAAFGNCCTSAVGRPSRTFNAIDRGSVDVQNGAIVAVHNSEDNRAGRAVECKLAVRIIGRINRSEQVHKVRSQCCDTPVSSYATLFD